MGNIPNELKYTKSHEWVRIEKNGAVIGITDYAQSLLGDVVYVELPEIGVEFSAEEGACVVESVKAASDIYSPIDGEIIEINESLEDEPAKINQEPYGDGWLFRMNISDISQLDNFMSANEYSKIIED